tara:strand:- start:71 stop:1234 length:1164 start_codon:yes stop_codon:yes gene_type:complete
MNILGFNPAHHGSACLLEDGELKFFIQEERIGRREKYTSYPFKSFIELIQKYKIEHITWGAPSTYYPLSTIERNIPYWQQIAFSYHPKVEGHNFSKTHHITHAAHSFYNSGFKKAIGVIIDGMGSNFKNIEEDLGQETETIFECSYPSNFKVLYKNLVNHPEYSELKDSPSKNIKVSNNINLSRVYETITMHLGWSRNEAGKTMGLAPYGKFDSTLPPFFQNKTGNPNVFFENMNGPSLYHDVPQQTFINEESNPLLKLSNDPREWHHNESKITDLEKDMAWKVQNDTQQIVGDYIEEAIKETGLKQVCCAGGYFLNCVTNYYLTKRFPDVEFYFEPIANDAGTAIGAAKLIWHESTQDTTIRPFKSLYLGKQYSKEELLEGIKKYT